MTLITVKIIVNSNILQDHYFPTNLSLQNYEKEKIFENYVIQENDKWPIPLTFHQVSFFRSVIVADVKYLRKIKAVDSTITHLSFLKLTLLTDTSLGFEALGSY